jgi:hypothetical protein
MGDAGTGAAVYVWARAREARGRLAGLAAFPGLVAVTVSSVESSRDKEEISVPLAKSELVPSVLVEALLTVVSASVGKRTPCSIAGMRGVFDRGASFGVDLLFEAALKEGEFPLEALFCLDLDLALNLEMCLDLPL